MTTNQPRTAVRRIWWIIRTTLIMLIALSLGAAVLAGLGYAGFLGVKEIQRSDNSLAMRIEANKQNLDSLRDLVNAEFAEGNPEQQVQLNQLENELAVLNNHLEALQTARAEDTAVQAAKNSALEDELATAVAHNISLTSDLETVQAALVALQSDLNSNSGRLDALGGDLDHLRLQISTLGSDLAALSTETAAARSESEADVQQSITLLHLWSVLTNARLYLINDNTASAETAVAQAIPLAAALNAEPETSAAAALQRLQARLSLAAGEFATDLPMAAQDLDAASTELMLLMSGSSIETELSATPTAPTVTETAAATATPSPSETPLPSPTATP